MTDFKTDNLDIFTKDNIYLAIENWKKKQNKNIIDNLNALEKLRESNDVLEDVVIKHKDYTKVLNNIKCQQSKQVNNIISYLKYLKKDITDEYNKNQINEQINILEDTLKTIHNSN